ncbi:MAG: hypothetical protein HYU51_09645 [Candidatus Rokubacteria bacterium]|nr:hypothetical protein [Candidatus Rokubacteria bacterium]
MTARLRVGVTAMAVDAPARFRELVWVERLSALLARGVRHLNVFLLGADRHAMVQALADEVLPRLRDA